MKNRKPSLKGVMTPFPFTVNKTESVEKARDILEEHGFHHLPVVSDGKPFGLISSLDISWALEEREALAPEGELHVERLCRTEPLVVELDSSLAVVVREMAELCVSAAIVIKTGRVVGVLTTSDVCKALADLVDPQTSHPDDILA